MSELSQNSTLLRATGGRLVQNPVAVKELRSRMRGRRAFLLLSGQLLLMSLVTTLAYAGAVGSQRITSTASRQVGSNLFYAVLAFQAFLVMFLTPAFTAGSISSEKEQHTYDILRTTLLSAPTFVSGKLLAALAFILLLVGAAIPLQSVAFVLGGVSLGQLVISQLMLVAGAVAFSLLGLLISSLMRSTLAATVGTYAVTLFTTGGIPLLVLIAGSFIVPLFFGGFGSTPGWRTQAVLIYLGIGLAATNLPASLLISQLILANEGALFAYSASVDGHTIWIPSPWIPFLLLSALSSLLLFRLTVRRVRRVASS